MAIRWKAYSKRIGNTLSRKTGEADTSNQEPEFHPLISYITVAYNAEKTIERTIKSIASCKSLIHCEYIVVDGNSTDETGRVLGRNSHIIDTLLREDDSGIYDAMNKGVRLAKGQYLCFINADDYLNPDGVGKLAQRLRSNSDTVEIVASAAFAVDGSTELLWLATPPDHFAVFKCPNLCHNGVYAKKSVFTNLGGFDTRFQIAADSDWLIRAYRSGIRIQAINTPTVSYQIGGASSNIRLHAEEMLAIAQKYYPKLDIDVVRALFYHLFAWQERRGFFTEHPMYNLRQAIRQANKIYPELSMTAYWNGQKPRAVMSRVYAKIGNMINARSS